MSATTIQVAPVLNRFNDRRLSKQLPRRRYRGLRLHPGPGTFLELRSNAGNYWGRPRATSLDRSLVESADAEIQKFLNYQQPQRFALR